MTLAPNASIANDPFRKSAAADNLVKKSKIPVKETPGADPKSSASPNMLLSRCAWSKRLIEESIMRGIHEATFLYLH